MIVARICVSLKLCGVCMLFDVFGQELAKGLKVLTSKKVRENLESKSQYALMSNLASSSVLVDLLSKVSPSNG